MSVAARLAELGITLPDEFGALASYVPSRRSGNLVFIAGQGPIAGGKAVMRGKLGREFTVAEGMEAARMSIVNGLAVINREIGDLDRVTQIVKLNGYVNSTDDFEDQHLVINGASELLVEIFGETGRHARAAVGTNTLPFGVPVEIEMVVEVKL
ncbi:RidA family protein [Rhizobium leguminosarum]|uniref:Endoribonuclease L-PSP n=1 Tax=Rhizobium leguminosarum TaxID=384 RepID=A0A2K9ZGQ7_RHILE|nr:MULTISPECIES: RidA family protein [Rhizobium]AUW47221.1 Endoribonuclease L-PSP [Rhizobium leguminosarum]NEH49809.1 RidA family protein [Rhizobium leguminosarum]NEH57663.1 RidA family protein [Rhizobium leguminosarum]NKK29651.1 RidA family protein [Rhizobium leguminosarum bv. viciae]TBZ54172.1 RidA family protein [Rhizobium leguminosarum bv. viciae]